MVAPCLRRWRLCRGQTQGCAQGSRRLDAGDHQSLGIRVLGRFAEADWFVGLEWRPRSTPMVGFDKVPLCDTRAGDEWEFAIIEVIQRWDKILPGATYIKGPNHRDYVTENSSR